MQRSVGGARSTRRIIRQFSRFAEDDGNSEIVRWILDKAPRRSAEEPAKVGRPNLLCQRQRHGGIRDWTVYRVSEAPESGDVVRRRNPVYRDHSVPMP